jgi:hypothetical protein
LNNNEPAAGHASFAVNPQSAIRNPQLPRPPARRAGGPPPAAAERAAISP